MTFILDTEQIKEHQQRLMQIISKRSFGQCKEYLMKKKYPALEGNGLFVMALIELAAIVSRDYCKNDRDAFLVICQLKAARIFGISDEEQAKIENIAKDIIGDPTKQ